MTCANQKEDELDRDFQRICNQQDHWICARAQCIIRLPKKSPRNETHAKIVQPLVAREGLE